MKKLHKSVCSDKSELRDAVPGSVPGSGSELGTRLLAVIKLYGRREDAARAAGVSTEQLRRYLKGESDPSLPTMAKLCGPVGVSVQWLATGEGPMMWAEVERFAREVEKATEAATLFALRRSSVSREDLYELQEAAHEYQLDVDGLEARYGAQYPIGDTTKMPDIDPELLQMVVEVVLQHVGPADPQRASRLTAQLYDYMAAKGSRDRGLMLRFLKLVA